MLDMTFKELISEEKIQKALQEAGYTAPTPIQAKAIPIVLAGSDVRASAQTGTGKTAAFILPMLVRLMTASKGRGPRVLILAPTRELAMQIAAETAKYSKYLPHIKTVCVFGGAPYPAQYRQLAKPHDILIATPGRLIDHLDQKRVNLSTIETLILDEADRMLDMGFIKPVEKIAAATPKMRQTVMFSATMQGAVLNLSKRLLREPIEITVAPAKTKHENIEQRLHMVESPDHKYRLLISLLKDPSLKQAIVFTSTKHHAKRLMDKLCKSGYSAAALHGNLNQRQRSRTLEQMRQGTFRILVATDIAARGIDVQTISHVINFDLPRCAEDYVHRIGRTGRAKSTGVAISFALAKDKKVVREIEKFTGHKIGHSHGGALPK